MEKYYHENRAKIYDLIKLKDDETLYIKFPKIKIYRKFIDLIIEVFHEEFGYAHEPYFVSKIIDEVLTICEKIYVNTNDMLNDRELVKYLYLKLDRNFGSDELLVVFTPEVFNKHSDEGSYYLRFLCVTLDLSENITINGEKYQKLFEKLRLIKERYSRMFNDTSLFVILFYCYLYNNYEYLDNYLSDPAYYQDKLVMDGLVETPNYPFFAGDAKKIFRKVKSIFNQTDKKIE